MPLTAMNEMPDGLQALKRENLLGYEHVLGAHVWTGEDDPMMGFGDMPAPSGGISIPQSSGIPINIPDLNSLHSAGDFGNAIAQVVQATAANKLAKKQAQQNRGRGILPSMGAGGGGGDLMAYAPWAIGGVVVIGLLAYVSKKRKGD